eukprot:CAMPEP_0179433910 /NCGR_PEP_ID=MMETSP0799-20121207/18245_1 /TAXON_ID=46947 /ORGANISM="Geminigera cryophila, Strain CCMP2564" /LENGTH=138 /DNA_ID=CAMNT_0021212203 /DNA_START=537 /DNA_END=951 /DNA_ORIENTATION=+
MANYGSIGGVGSPGLGLHWSQSYIYLYINVACDRRMALVASAVVTATISWAQAQPTVLEQFELVPLGASYGLAARPRMMGLSLDDDLAKNLPEERVYETDGVAPMPRCPGAWCDKTPFRVYPDGRAEFGVAPDMSMMW